MTFKQKFQLVSILTNVLLVMISLVLVTKLLLGWALLSWVGIGTITWVNENIGGIE